MSALDVLSIRNDFPVLAQQIRGKPLIYLDNAASSQKPNSVIDAISNNYRFDYANIHRGVHTLSQRSTDSFEGAREKVRAFLNAESIKEIIFVRGATEGINLIAQSYGRSTLGQDDEIIITTMEHHANIVPWQMLCEQTGARLRVVPMTERGELILDDYAALFNSKTRLVSVAHMSNALGTINPIAEMIKTA
ncbi:MAG TPA: aminotransferase class V-fold PLP-dependent enzyme, partial [Methylococcales bacterium]|nr:aminotransferase class V-fold PLP-dependent enzyme [Methylococcales bacterium]